MLDVLAQPNSTCVRANGDAELGSHQEDGEHFIDAAQAATVNLTELNSARLEKLLEEHAVLAMLASSHTDRSDGPRDCCVAQNVVRARRLLDPPRIELRQVF